MNWFIAHLMKEARGRRFRSEDRVRYFTDSRKGKGKGIVLTPSFGKGTVVNFDNAERRYKVRIESGEVVDVHPRNIMPDSFSRSPVSTEALPMALGPSGVGIGGIGEATEGASVI